MQQLTETSEKLASAVRIGFLLAEGFDFYALAAALEPLRQANDVARCVVCEWQILSLEGQPLKANNGIVAATLQLSQAKPLDVLILCLGSELQLCTDDSVRESLALLTKPTCRTLDVGELAELISVARLSP
ncbi:TPA: hypothetical protein ACNV18_000713 [Pseudomonas putida]|uniref:Uncharacterized protein n=1 Tax=Pseudomonas putida TaxID=303 RepID=A0ABD7B724_PSEPU|nr:MULTISPECIES: hypothetical protein [Pseudomonas]MBA1318886.1 hypothetical protein [Pseudomonas monteilii]MCE1020782.1 hypothetical protein [Pseudomonas monteilii]MCE1038266.1 hypothetical protein [Pseudomonas monteilii]MCE1089876.1 hypothetical protein [Pseudomonas monteilii]MDH0023518.1 hypothetical protein [Pseudomonas monteilii]